MINLKYLLLYIKEILVNYYGLANNIVKIKEPMIIFKWAKPLGPIKVIDEVINLEYFLK